MGSLALESAGKNTGHYWVTYLQWAERVLKQKKLAPYSMRSNTAWLKKDYKAPHSTTLPSKQVWRAVWSDIMSAIEVT